MGAEVGMVNCRLLAPRCILIQKANALPNCPAKRAHRTCKFWRGGWGKQTLNLWYASTLWPSSLISQEASVYDEILRRKGSRTPGERRGQRDKRKLLHILALSGNYILSMSALGETRNPNYGSNHTRQRLLAAYPVSTLPYFFLTEPQCRKVWPCDQGLANEI